MKDGSSAGEHYLDRVGVMGSIPIRPIFEKPLYDKGFSFFRSNKNALQS